MLVFEFGKRFFFFFFFLFEKIFFFLLKVKLAIFSLIFELCNQTAHF